MGITQREYFRRPVKKVLVVHRTHSPAALGLAREVSHWLKERKIQVFSPPRLKVSPAVPRIKAEQVRKIDLALVLGGDGTYLEAVRLLDNNAIPILGVNLGSLGFLTTIRVEDIYHALELTMGGKMQVRHRSLIQVEVRRGTKLRDIYYALNDVVIERGSSSQLLHLATHIDRQLVATLKADGLIIATPTGSTAYNLASGGPILHPEVRAVVVTPICPHSLTNRPLIVPDERHLTFRLVDKHQRGTLTIDGRKASEVNSQDEIRVFRAGADHLVLRKPTDNYFNLLRQKLKFGERD